MIFTTKNDGVRAPLQVSLAQAEQGLAQLRGGLGRRGVLVKIEGVGEQGGGRRGAVDNVSVLDGGVRRLHLRQGGRPRAQPLRRSANDIMRWSLA